MVDTTLRALAMLTMSFTMDHTEKAQLLKQALCFNVDTALQRAFSPQIFKAKIEKKLEK